MEGLRSTTLNVIQDVRCLGRISHGGPPENKPGVFLPEQRVGPSPYSSGVRLNLNCVRCYPESNESTNSRAWIAPQRVFVSRVVLKKNSDCVPEQH
jgi:hypothetical protein